MHCLITLHMYYIERRSHNSYSGKLTVCYWTHFIVPTVFITDDFLNGPSIMLIIMCVLEPDTPVLYGMMGSDTTGDQKMNTISTC